MSIKNRLKLTFKGLRPLFLPTSETRLETSDSGLGTRSHRESNEHGQHERPQLKEEKLLGAVTCDGLTYQVIQLERHAGKKWCAFDVIRTAVETKHPLKQRFIFDPRTAWKIALMLLKIAVDDGQPKGSRE